MNAIKRTRVFRLIETPPSFAPTHSSTDAYYIGYEQAKADLRAEMEQILNHTLQEGIEEGKRLMQDEVVVLHLMSFGEGFDAGKKAGYKEGYDKGQEDRHQAIEDAYEKEFLESKKEVWQEGYDQGCIDTEEALDDYYTMQATYKSLPL